MGENTELFIIFLHINYAFNRFVLLSVFNLSLPCRKCGANVSLVLIFQ